MFPLVEELTPCPDVLATAQAFADLPDVLLLESALRRPDVGDFSFLTADPFERFERQRSRSGQDPFEAARRALGRWQSAPIPELPPFQGGAAGLLSYELGGCWERIPAAARDEFQLPVLHVGVYDWVIAWNHAAGRAWLISQGFPETDPARRADRAGRRLAAVRERLRQRPGPPASASTKTLAADDLAPQWPAPGLAGLTSNFSRDAYLQAVSRVIEYIHSGDIFQANLSQRLLFPLRKSPLETYAKLRRCNPAPFAAFYAADDWAVVSASPERFVCLRDGAAESRPIKGTRRRAEGPEADLFARDALRESAKDQAENVMIVDLLRNDLSRVCRPGSIRVPVLCNVETYETVQHLVSQVRGELADGRTAWDLFGGLFPGGSISGAPKVRAMEIIAELEPTVRGPYTGSLFYVGFDGNADSSLLIRTFTIRHGWIQCPVGGGIVAQSDPLSEYEETLHKAAGMLRALS